MCNNYSTAGEKLVVSPKYLDELKKLPASVLSFEEAHNEVGLSSDHNNIAAVAKYLPDYGAKVHQLATSELLPYHASHYKDRSNPGSYPPKSHHVC